MSLIRVNQETMNTYLELYKIWLKNCEGPIFEGKTFDELAKLSYITSNIETVKAVGLILDQGHKIVVINDLSEISDIVSSFYLLRVLLIQCELLKEDELILGEAVIPC